MNRSFLLQGRSDPPLTEEGILQAVRLRDWFLSQGIRFDRVCSSPLLRAVQTAGIVAGECAPVKIDERLTEMDYGPYEGTDLRNLPPELAFFFSDFVSHTPPEGMEPLTAVKERLGDFLEELKTKRTKAKNILVSTHAIAMKGALEYLTPQSGGRYWSKHIRTCAVYTAELRDDVFTVPVELPTEV